MSRRLSRRLFCTPLDAVLDDAGGRSAFNIFVRTRRLSFGLLLVLAFLLLVSLVISAALAMLANHPKVE